MKIFNLVIVFHLIAAVSAAAQTARSAGIQFWEGDWASALAKSSEDGKLIFLDVYASWCGPCKKLKRTTFANEKVGKFFNENFICVAVDGERGEGPSLARKYSVRGYPTLLFIDGLGNVFHQEIGYIKAKQLFRVGDNVLGDYIKRAR